MSYKEHVEVAEQLLQKTIVPTLPSAITQLQTLYQEHATPNPNKVKELLSMNPYIAGEIVGLANIPALTNSAHVKITDIDSAIYRLGNKYIKNYAMAITVKELLNTSKIAGLSVHSQIIANIAAKIAHYSDYIRPDEAYLLGLLHDIGAFILAELNSSYGEVFVGKQNNHFGLEEDEIALFGTSHSAIGYALAKSWSIPSYIAQTILLHHTPQLTKITNNKLRSLVAIIELAHSLSIKKNHAKYEGSSNDEICKESQEALGLTDEELDQIKMTL